MVHTHIQDSNVRLIRELKSEIKRLRAIITAAKLDDTDMTLGETDLELNIHKKEEMVTHSGFYHFLIDSYLVGFL